MQEAKKITYTYKGKVVEDDSEEAPVKRDTTKIYFFIVAIVALIATNIYFYVKYETSEERAYGMNSEIVYMQDEIDRIEAELNRLTLENAELSQALSVSEDSVRFLIAELRTKLEQDNLSHNDLNQAQQQINQLREDVFQYRQEMNTLREQNARLLTEKEELLQEVTAQSEKLDALEAENSSLADQIKVAAVLRLSDIQIHGVREQSGDRETVERRARRVDKFRIAFSFADNPLVEHGPITIYLRVIDQNGNLKTQDRQIFELSGNPMQYTDMTEITFTNNGESYSLDWVDPNGFKKGTYTLVLYTHNATLGHSSIVLN